uniref:Uncharacterized protein n=1 Tax=Arundo donax TaxID=35708 RepID=A0A0A9B7I6_ARUDO
MDEKAEYSKENN